MEFLNPILKEFLAVIDKSYYRLLWSEMEEKCFITCSILLNTIHVCD